MHQIDSIDELAKACRRFSAEWLGGAQPRLEDYLAACAEHLRGAAFPEFLRAELRARSLQHHALQETDYLGRFPGYQTLVRAAFAEFPAAPVDPPPASGGTTRSSTGGAQGTTPSQLDVSVPTANNDAAAQGSARAQAGGVPSEGFLRGERIGRYRVFGKLGRGAFGSVYLAEDDRLDRTVAVKVVERSLSSDDVRDVQKSHEARVVARLDHPSIAPVYDVGVTAGGRLFIVSKYIAGQSLDKVLQRGPLPVSRARQVARDIADALSAVHQQGLTHRDVKPANIILCDTLRAVLVDFGIAIADEVRSDRFESAGTPVYMSPEQAGGKLKSLDGRADLFSLGAVLYEMLTGVRAFPGGSPMEALGQILSTEPRPPRQLNPAIPPDLEAVALRCLKKDPAQRFASAADLVQALDQLDPSATPPPIKRIGVRLQSLAAGLGLLLVGGAFWAARSSMWPSPPANAGAGVASAPASSGATADPAVAAELRLVAADLRALLDQREQQRYLKRLGPPDDAAADPVASQPHPAQSAGPLVLPRGFEELESQLAQAREDADEDEEFRLLLKATNELIDQRHYRLALAAAQRMVQVSGEAPSRKPIAYGQLGLAQYKNGDVRQAVRSYEVCLADYQKLYNGIGALPANEKVREYLSQIARLLGLTWMRMGNAQAFDERFQQARVSYDTAKSLFERHDRADEMLTLLLNYGSLESRGGDHKRAVALLSQGVELARKLQRVHDLAELLVNLANAQSRAGDPEAALIGYQEAAELVTRESSYQLRTAVLSNWALTLVELGQIDEARHVAGRLREIVQPPDMESERVLALLAEPADGP